MSSNSNPHITDEASRVAQEWAKQIHLSQIAKGLRPADGEPDDDEVVDIVKEVKEVIEEVKENISDGNSAVEATRRPFNPNQLAWRCPYSFTKPLGNIFWCLHEECLEVIEPFNSEDQLKYHLFCDHGGINN